MSFFGKKSKRKSKESVLEEALIESQKEETGRLTAETKEDAVADIEAPQGEFDSSINEVYHPDALNTENFRSINGYDWDMVMFFPVAAGEGAAAAQQSEKRGAIVQALHGAGVETYLYYSAQKDEVVCKLRCPVARLRQYADQINYKFLLDEAKCEAACAAGREGVFQSFRINGDPAISKLSPYAFIYGSYVADAARVDPELYRKGRDEKGGHTDHPFTQVHRIKLIEALVNDGLRTLYANYSWQVLLHHGDLIAFFPLHNERNRRELAAQWIPGAWARFLLFGRAPLDEIRAYFGEKIGLYFAFLGHYTIWLVPLAAVGIALAVWDCIQLTLSSALMPYYCVFVAFWSVLLLEYWKRAEARHAMEWGMVGFEEQERDRPEFHGEEITSYIDGRPMLHFPDEALKTRRRVSSATIWTYILLVVACVAAIFWFKTILKNSGNGFLDTYYSTIASFLNAVQIQIFNAIYQKVSVRLNDAENFRTDSEYEDGLIAKTFLFQFVNSYATFYYTAFVKTYVEGCDYGYVDEYDSCMYDLALSLGIIFCTRIVSAHLLGVTVPRFMARRRAKKELEGTDASVELSPAEQEYTLDKYDKLMGTLKDFAELSIQFGYVTLFVTAFPIAPALAWFANYIQIGVNARKLLFEAQRAMPSGLQDIGAWQGIFETLAGVAVITNAGLVVFTSNKFDHWGFTTAQEVWIFIIMQYLVFGVMRFFANLVEDVPFDVQVQIKRSAHIEAKLILQVPDDAGDVDRSLMVDKDRDGVADPAGPMRGGDDGARSGTD